MDTSDIRVTVGGRPATNYTVKNKGDGAYEVELADGRIIRVKVIAEAWANASASATGYGSHASAKSQARAGAYVNSDMDSGARIKKRAPRPAVDNIKKTEKPSSATQVEKFSWEDFTAMLEKNGYLTNADGVCYNITDRDQLSQLVWRYSLWDKKLHAIGLGKYAGALTPENAHPALGERLDRFPSRLIAYIREDLTDSGIDVSAMSDYDVLKKAGMTISK